MAARRTAYLHSSEPVASGDVTVDVYVLWPDGSSSEAASLLERTARDVLEQVKHTS